MNRERLIYLARHPKYTLRRLGYFVYERLHPGEPWIAQDAVAFCDRNLDRTMRGLETGSGRSTAWFAKRLKHLTSVEHDRAWYEKVEKRIRHLENIDYRYVPLDHPEGEPTRAEYEQTPRYVAVFDEFDDASLDFVVVDGHYRQACVRAALSKLRSGGLLLVDNSNWLSREAWGVPSSYDAVHKSENVMSETSIWAKR